MHVQFIVEYKDKNTGKWTTNTFPLFRNLKYFLDGNKNKGRSPTNLPYKMMPTLLEHKYVIATLAPGIVRGIPLSTTDMFLPSDMDPLSPKFLDMESHLHGTLFIEDLETYAENGNLDRDIITETVYTTKELAEKYKKTKELPDPCYKFTYGEYNQEVEVSTSLSKISGQSIYLYKILPEDLKETMSSLVDNVMTDVRLLYTVTV